MRLSVLHGRNERDDILGDEGGRSQLRTRLFGGLPPLGGLLGRLSLDRSDLELVVPAGELEGESAGELSDDLDLLELLGEVGGGKGVSESSLDVGDDLGLQRSGRELGPVGGRVGGEGGCLDDRLGVGLDRKTDEAVEEVGEDGRPLVNEETLDERAEDPLARSEDHLLLEDDLESLEVADGLALLTVGADLLDGGGDGTKVSAEERVERVISTGSLQGMK